MINSRHTNKLLKVANAAYPDGLIEELRKGEEQVGDGLAEFIFNEMKETADGSTPREITENVIKALETAEGELHQVISALREIKHRPIKGRKGLKNFTVFWTTKGQKIYKARTEEEAEELQVLDSLAIEAERVEDVFVKKGGEE